MPWQTIVREGKTVSHGKQPSTSAMSTGIIHPAGKGPNTHMGLPQKHWFAKCGIINPTRKTGACEKACGKDGIDMVRWEKTGKKAIIAVMAASLAMAGCGNTASPVADAASVQEAENGGTADGIAVAMGATQDDAGKGMDNTGMQADGTGAVVTYEQPGDDAPSGDGESDTEPVQDAPVVEAAVETGVNANDTIDTTDGIGDIGEIGADGMDEATDSYEQPQKDDNTVSEVRSGYYEAWELVDGIEIIPTTDKVLEKYGSYENFADAITAEVNALAISYGNTGMVRNDIADYIAYNVAMANYVSPGHIVGHIPAYKYPALTGMYRSGESIMYTTTSGYWHYDAATVAYDMTVDHTTSIVMKDKQVFGISVIPVTTYYYNYKTGTYYERHNVDIVMEAYSAKEWNDIVLGNQSWAEAMDNGQMYSQRSIFQGGVIPQ